MTNAKNNLAFNIDASQREIDSRAAQGEDMTNACINKKTGLIYFKKVKAIATPEVTPEATPEVIEETTVTKFLTVLTARNIEQYSKDTDRAINSLKSNAHQINLIFNKPEFAEILAPFLRKCRIADPAQNRTDFVAVKVLVKVFNTLAAIASGQLRGIDNHTKIIGFQLLKLSEVTNKTAQVVQSKSINYNALDRHQTYDTKNTADYSVGTTGTQTSSTRMLFNYMGLCNVVKCARNDVIKVANNERSKSFIALFAKNKHEEFVSS